MESNSEPQNVTCLNENWDVGHLVSAKGVNIDPKDLEAVYALKDKTPATVRDVRGIIGFLSYYRSYTQDFSKVAKPIYELLDLGIQRDHLQGSGVDRKGRVHS